MGFPASNLVLLNNLNCRIIEMKTASMNESWKDLYLAALLERNKAKLPLRIARAEKRISARALELCDSIDRNNVEKSVLNIALYVLAALRSSLTRDEGDPAQRYIA
jgi:hypothetical protein